MDNNNDMSELFNKVNSMMNEGKIPDDMKNMLSSFVSNNSNSSSNTDNPMNGIDIETIMKLKTAIDKMNTSDDPRTNLLKSLKPYLKDTRKEKIDEYIKLLNMGKVMEVFKDLGGDSK